MDDRVDEERLMAGFWVGGWFVEPLRNRISSVDEALPVEPKIMDVLVCLAQQPGRTITKDRFMEQVWAGMVVSDDVLSRCISELRKLLGDDSRAPTFIETIRKTGYRLIAPVKLPTGASGAPVELGGHLLNGAGADQHPVALSTLWHLFRQSLRAWARQRRVFLMVLGGIAAVLAAGGGGYLLWRYAAGSTPEPPVTVPFTTYPGLEVDPQLSPDGQQVAYASDDESGQDFDVYIKQYGAEIPLRITDERSDERHPVWSPDGLHLAFVRSASGQHAVFIVPSIGGNERKVIDFGARGVQGLAWSPDGGTLAASVQHARFGAYHIFLVGVDSASVHELTRPPATAHGDLDPAWSPDGLRLSFTRSLNEEVQDVFVASLADGRVDQLTFDSTRVAGHGWTQDGEGIILASQRGGLSGGGLWRVDGTGGEPVQIAMASEGQVLEHPSVARRGERLTYVQRSSDANIWKLSRTASDAIYRAQPLIASTKWDSNPAISPGGDRIAFASLQSGFHEIWLTDADGGNPVQLTSFAGAYTGTPAWSPDGLRIAFVSRQAGGADVYVASATGGTPRRLTRAPAEDSAPSWSRDSVSVYFASDRSGAWEIWKVPYTGGEAVQVTTGGGRAAREAPDGSALYYVRPDTAGIWRMPLPPADSSADSTGRRDSLVVDAFDPGDWGNWVVVDEGIYFVRRLEATPVLFFYAFATGLERRVDTLNNVPDHPALSIVPDGMWLLYTQLEAGESDILLVDHFR